MKKKILNPVSYPKIMTDMLARCDDSWGKALSLRIFEEFRHTEEYEMNLTYAEIWELLGGKGKVSYDKISALVKRIVNEFTFVDEPYVLNDGGKFSGSAIQVLDYTETNEVRFAISPLLKRYVITDEQREFIFMKKAEKIELNESKKDELLSAEKAFKDHTLLSKLDLKVLRGSKYALGLYEFLMRHRHYDGRYRYLSISVERLRTFLSIPKSYKLADIKRKTINPARKELKKVGLDIKRIDYQKAKGSRAVTSIRFYYRYDQIVETVVAVEAIIEDISKNKQFMKDLSQIKESAIFDEILLKEFEESYKLTKKLVKEYNLISGVMKALSNLIDIEYFENVKEPEGDEVELMKYKEELLSLAQRLPKYLYTPFRVAVGANNNLKSLEKLAEEYNLVTEQLKPDNKDKPNIVMISEK